MPAFSAILIGHESLAVQCGQMLLDAGHAIRAVVSRNADVLAWARGRGLMTVAPGKGLADRLAGVTFDWLFSVANLDIIPAELLGLARRGAVNFHDGPLPRYAGLNAPVWAILNGEARHGITWHLIEGGVDEGDILEQRLFDMAPGETALTLNTKCYAAGIETFPALIAQLDSGDLRRQKQDLAQRSYVARDKRPAAAGVIDFAQPAEQVAAMVHALDHGDYANPLTCAKLWLQDGFLIVSGADGAAGGGVPGTVLAVTPDAVTVACGTGAVRLTGLRHPWGMPATVTLAVGDVLPPVTEAPTLESALAATLRAEGSWRARLDGLAPVPVPALGGASGTDGLRQDIALPPGTTPAQALAGLAALALRMADMETGDFALATAPAHPLHSDRVPVRFAGDAGLHAALATFAAGCADALAQAPMAADLPARMGKVVPPRPAIALSLVPTGLLPGTALTLCATDAGAVLHGCPAQLSPAAFALIAERLAHIVTVLPGLPDTAHLADLPLIAPAEHDRITTGWSATDLAITPTCLHHAFEAQVARTPDAPALTFEGTTITYADLNARANLLAHRLIAAGVRPGTLVGLHLRRSAELLVGALAILKAGGAYVPLDPAYPADRIALYLEDSGAPLVVTDAGLAQAMPRHAATLVLIGHADDGPATNPETSVTPGDLAYLIYTSGSTGRPKGVMIEHRNVANFMAGMDARIPHDPPGVWLAVTSLSFDISVLELFWTLARGFHVVMSGDENRALVSSGQMRLTGKGMEFGLFYWGNDDGAGRDKYRLLLDGARFADAHGFSAIWTPERHFHAFGGPYPNPSVTGAAVAAVTRNIAVRAGSCVAPLHHPARVAEEWAVIDNLTDGRAGLAIASGWQPDDFVLRPENTPPHNKAAMLAAIDQIRRLWAGEAVAFPTADGGTFAVTTQPRPVSKKLPIWVTTAGNPDTWREAGAIGANVLTHLLGQSIDEVAGKIGLYHDALRKAGHDPADHKVTLMLHTYLADTRDKARKIAREPMKAYLRAAAALIKQYAWAFPAFKKPAGITNPMDIDLRSLSEDEVEGILDFAFLRYFDDSGLFGTIQDALLRVEKLKRIGVDEIACLIDYGIAVDTVLDGLKPLAEVLARANMADDLAPDDYSIAAQIVRHGVTHLQCTPSMARMLVTNDEARLALSRVRQLMIGGEALPGSLVQDLRRATRARIENMYGPTETTIWSTTQAATGEEAVTGIGTPIANTRIYVLDDALHPVPVGQVGELFIGGAGVARGYWQRPDLTAERFLPDPFRAGERIYRTGDLVRWRADGSLDFLGRADSQVKLRGYRIELGEIEAVMDSHPGIAGSVVIAREDVPGLVQLVGYHTASGVEEGALRATLAARLPDHMVPTRFVALDAFPLTPNKKVDRKALPAPAQRQTVAAVAASAPQDGSAGRIGAIWSRILGVPTIGPRDNFFDLGGHSLLAVQAHREIRDTLGAQGLSITDIFRFPVLAALADRVDALTRPKGEAAPSNGPPANVPPANVPAANVPAANVPAAPGPRTDPAPQAGPGLTRLDAMARRRDLRARRTGQG